MALNIDFWYGSFQLYPDLHNPLDSTNKNASGEQHGKLIYSPTKSVACVNKVAIFEDFNVA